MIVYSFLKFSSHFECDTLFIFHLVIIYLALKWINSMFLPVFR